MSIRHCSFKIFGSGDALNDQDPDDAYIEISKWVIAHRNKWLREMMHCPSLGTLVQPELLFGMQAFARHILCSSEECLEESPNARGQTTWSNGPFGFRSLNHWIGICEKSVPSCRTELARLQIGQLNSNWKPSGVIINPQIGLKGM